MSVSEEERDRARSRGRVGLQAHDNEEAPPRRKKRSLRPSTAFGESPKTSMSAT